MIGMATNIERATVAEYRCMSDTERWQFRQKCDYCQPAKARQQYWREHDGVRITACEVEYKRQCSLSRQRAKSHENLDVLTRPLAERGMIRLKRITNMEIEARRLSVPAGWDGGHIVDRRGWRLWLVHDEYWYEYTRRESHRVGASYLCGADRQQCWAVRVPRTIMTVKGAEEWLKPAQVKQADRRGLRVVRQGDIYFVEMLRGPSLGVQHNFTALTWTNHVVCQHWTGTVVVVHPQHEVVSFPPGSHYRAYRQTQIDSVGRRSGD